MPNTSKISFTEKRKSIIESLSNEFAIVINQLDLCLVRLEDLFKKAQKKFEELKTTVQYPPETLFLTPESLVEELNNKSLLLVNSSDRVEFNKKIILKQRPQPSINKQFDRLVKLLNDNHKSGFENFIFCSNDVAKKTYK